LADHSAAVAMITSSPTATPKILMLIDLKKLAIAWIGGRHWPVLSIDPAHFFAATTWRYCPGRRRLRL
jgi:hypothetical protein